MILLNTIAMVLAISQRLQHLRPALLNLLIPLKEQL